MRARLLLPVRVQLRVPQPSSWLASPFRVPPPEGAAARGQRQGHGRGSFVRQGA